MKIIKCPICAEELVSNEKSLLCSNGHLFDKAKSGYVNLLRSNSVHGHGDDKLMLQARTNFLEKGYYSPLRDKLCEIAKKNRKENFFILDAGCGEGYYSEKLAEYCDVGAYIDVSKAAVEKTAKRMHKNGIFLASSVYDLPFFDKTFDMIFSVFSPLADEEFFRTLKPGGKLVRVIPLEEHLFELKQAVYDDPYYNEVPERKIEGFTLEETYQLKYEIELSTNEEIRSLFNMTPYSHKTSKKDVEKLDNLQSVKCHAQFGVLVYTKAQNPSCKTL